MPFVPTLKEDDLAIVITVYEPDPDRWIDYVSSRCEIDFWGAEAKL